MIPRLSLAGIACALLAVFASPITAQAQVQSSPWDDATAGAILAAIQKNPALSGSTITVDCYAGIVMLTGLVPNFELRESVEQAVRQTPGTTRIIDELNQEADRNPSDASRDAVIQSTLDMTLAQYTSGGSAIVIARGHVYDGIVYLLGSVSDANMNDLLQSSIMALPGVHAVVAHLAIQQRPSAPIAAAAMPPAEATAALPQALSMPRATKPTRKQTKTMLRKPEAVPPQDEDETADRIVRATPQPIPAAISPAASKHGAGHAYAVQLASEFDDAAARLAWQRKQTANRDVLGDLTPVVTRVDLGVKGIRYRLKAGPLPDQTAAAQLCATLTTRHVACMVVRSEGDGAPRPIAPRHAVTKAEPTASPAPAAPPMPAAKPVAPRPALATTPPVPAPAPAPAGGPSTKPAHTTPYFIQLASRSSEAAARAYWSAQSQSHGDLLGDLSPTVTAADLGAKGIMYRLKAGPLADRTAAASRCARLAKQGLDCLVVRDVAARPAP